VAPEHVLAPAKVPTLLVAVAEEVHVGNVLSDEGPSPFWNPE
jgi:hypothetical protein